MDIYRVSALNETQLTNIFFIKMRNINVQLFKKELNIQGVSPINTPVYATTGSAGADIYANLKEPVVLQPGDSAMIPTGVFIAIPEGYEA